ncbi:MAG: hypothetical protein ACI9YU_000621 [Flavobacteriales bacterium]|jgi:hypothetical protein
MSIAEDCLGCLQRRDWIGLNRIVSNDVVAGTIPESPTFTVFENVLVEELIKVEDDEADFAFITAARIFNLDRNTGSSFRVSEPTLLRIARFLFDHDAQEQFAKVLVSDEDAREFLTKGERERQSIIDNTKLGASLDIKVSESGGLLFKKKILNSPQEMELNRAAKCSFPNHIIIPNTALSTIIDSKICASLDQPTSDFFFKSTLDLCIVHPRSFIGEVFIELDSSWHDLPKQKENDSRKDRIFEAAGLKLHRIRKKENKNMEQAFALYINGITL